MYVNKLSNSNVLLYALSYYNSIHCLTLDDYKADLKLFRKLNNQLKKDDIRLVLNSMIICNNLFGNIATPRLLFYYVDPIYHNKIIALLDYMNIHPDIIPEIDITKLTPDNEYEFRLLHL